ncbi:MAG: class II fumarate hydratase [Bradymonadaceae bacterium]
METRTEHDSLGPVEVPVDRYWGAQTQRSLRNFDIGDQTMPRAMIRALGTVKWACAEANTDFGLMEEEARDLVQSAAREVIEGELDAHFPLRVWQTGSGTQTNMNTNEVIANRAIELAGGEIGTKEPIHPNDDVNMSQSTNDSFPTATNVAVVHMFREQVIPAVEHLRSELADKADEFDDIIKTGRTHLMDATPIKLGQEFRGYVGQLDYALDALEDALELLYEVPIGGTAVGTGLNTPEGFGEHVCEVLTRETGYPFEPARETYSQLAGKEPLSEAHGALKTLATSLNKLGNDIRWMSSGPRCGIGEISIPANEPGSSIMPGKINPTQGEALVMVCAQVFGNDATVSYAAGGGNFELNVYKPLLAHTVLESAELLADAVESFTDKCVVGIEPNEEQLEEYLEQSLMLVTALNPHIGYDKAAEVAKKAHREGTTLEEAVVELGYMTAEEFRDAVDPAEMVAPNVDAELDED